MDSGHNPYSQPCSVNSDTEPGEEEQDDCILPRQFPGVKAAALSLRKIREPAQN